MLGWATSSRPKAVAFDVIGTLFPLDPLREPLAALGLPPSALEGWFATALRDAFALAAAGDFKPFTEVLEGALLQVLEQQRLPLPSDGGKGLLAGLKALAPRPDAADAFAVLAEAGLPILAVSNGARASTEALLERAGLDRAVKAVVSVDDVKLSKPRREVYLHAAEVAKVEAGALALVAVHPWDINGAAAAGLLTAFVSAETRYPATMRPPTVEAPSLLEACRRLVAL